MSFTEICRGFVDRLKKTTLEAVFRRLFCAWFAVSFVFVIIGEGHFADADFFLSLSFAKTMAGIACWFVLLTVCFTVFTNVRAEKLLLFTTFLLYALSCVPQLPAVLSSSATTSAHKDVIWYVTGILLLLFAVCRYVFGDEDTSPLRFHVGKYTAAAAVGVCMALFSLYLCVQMVCRTLVQATPCFDFGIFSQMYYYMKETLQPLVTCERGVLMSHFNVHVSPIYYLFLPFYALVPRPETLQVCQALLLASGAVPLYLLCKQLKLSRKAAVAFTVCYLFYPALAGGCYYDLHENKFLAPLLLWLFLYIEKNKWWGVITFSVLVLLVKEDAPVYVAFVAVYLLIVKCDIKKGLVLLCMSLAYFGGVLTYLDVYGDGVMTYRYGNFIYESDGGLISVIKSVIMSPAKVITESFDAVSSSGEATKVEFMLQMLLPLGFLPFITRRYRRFILLCPFILVNLMPDYRYQHDIYFQYTYGATAFLMYLSVMNYSELSASFKRTYAAFIAAASVLMFSSAILQRSNYLDTYTENRENYDYVRQVLCDIPEEASVSSSTFYVTYASQRRVVYSRDNNNFDKNPIHTEYIVLDLRHDYSGKNAAAYKNEYEDSEEYLTVAYREGWIAVVRCADCMNECCDG